MNFNLSLQITPIRIAIEFPIDKTPYEYPHTPFFTIHPVLNQRQREISSEVMSQPTPLYLSEGNGEKARSVL
ncbi:hypothetical protein JTE90_028483 [Oedothorax gibbosus]|uniref:Uncharacterized protein n=1 Tax=Oedothorax gibbosus TaxID=931172 RepID=A0AAV6VUF0_9ARAC|nr:hypothetical protein JTE90_028483 [Oedothorax gibbosus]